MIEEVSFESPLFIRPADAQLARSLISASQAQPTIGQRMRIISERFLGYPYIPKPLIGSPVKPEVFVSRMDGFDCVTYLETVLALASADSIEDFLRRLRNIRYEQGEISFWRRLHYMTEWSRYNIRRGLLIDLTTSEETLVRTARLYAVSGLDLRTSTYRYFSRRRLGLVSPWLRDGDLIFFITTRDGLDTFHSGMIVRRNEWVMMRHATHHRHAVVEQHLDEFFAITPAPGFIINRPAEKFNLS